MGTTATGWTWKRTATGYEASDGRARLLKAGKVWTLVLADGSAHPMPRRASFDHAEAIIAARLCS